MTKPREPVKSRSSDRFSNPLGTGTPRSLDTRPPEEVDKRPPQHGQHTKKLQANRSLFQGMVGVHAHDYVPDAKEWSSFTTKTEGLQRL